MDRGEILGFLARAEVLVAQSDELLRQREQLAEILYRCDLDTTAASDLLGSVEQTLSELLAHRSHLVEELAQLDYADWLDSVSPRTSADDAFARTARALVANQKI